MSNGDRIMDAQDLLQGAEHIHRINEMIRAYGKYVIWMDKSDEWDTKAYDDVKNLGSLTLSVVDKSKHCGDDWNDNPASCNAGHPYVTAGSIEIDITDKTKIYMVDDMANLAIEILKYLRPNPYT